MSKTSLSLIVIFNVLLGLRCIANTPDLQVEVFSGKAASVNSFIFFDGQGSIIVDATRSSKDALEVAKIARGHGTEPGIIFITHGHPDHYLGMGTLKKEFPNVKFYVASQEIKDDIIGFSNLAAQNNWLSDEPLMRLLLPTSRSQSPRWRGLFF